MLDEEGNGELFLRDLEFEQDDWFYDGDRRPDASPRICRRPRLGARRATTPYDLDAFADGRFAFFVNGKCGRRLEADGQRRHARRPDRRASSRTSWTSRPTRCSAASTRTTTTRPSATTATVEEMAPTQGKFFAKLDKDDDHALWGNFKVRYVGERARAGRPRPLRREPPLPVDGRDHQLRRAARACVDGFAAEPGTVPSREEFRGTGGSLYFLSARTS